MSSLLQYPFALQFLRSMVPYEAWRHPDLLRLSHITTWIWVLAYAASALLYIVSRRQHLSCRTPCTFSVLSHPGGVATPAHLL